MATFTFGVFAFVAGVIWSEQVKTFFKLQWDRVRGFLKV